MPSIRPRRRGTSRKSRWWSQRSSSTNYRRGNRSFRRSMSPNQASWCRRLPRQRSDRCSRRSSGGRRVQVDVDGLVHMQPEVVDRAVGHGRRSVAVVAGDRPARRRRQQVHRVGVGGQRRRTVAVATPAGERRCGPGHSCLRCRIRRRVRRTQTVAVDIRADLAAYGVCSAAAVRAARAPEDVLGAVHVRRLVRDGRAGRGRA